MDWIGVEKRREVRRNEIKVRESIEMWRVGIIFKISETLCIWEILSRHLIIT